MQDKSEILYEDKLIEIRGDSLILKSYYFPSMSPKRIQFTDIERIEIKQASILTGKWRIQGTGDLRTWFPFDASRSKRDRIYYIYYKNKWVRSAFTVEDSRKTEGILRTKGLLI
jgi:hypothetical protein